MSRSLNGSRARDGKAEEPLRFRPEREPQGDTPKGGRPDWKKASARKVRETTAPAEPERREDIPPEQGQPAPEAVAVPETAGRADPLEGRADPFPTDQAAEPIPQAEHGEPTDDSRQAPPWAGAYRAPPRPGGPAAL